MQKTIRELLSSVLGFASDALRAAKASQKQLQKMCGTITLIGLLVPLMVSASIAFTNPKAPRLALDAGHIDGLASKHIDPKHIDPKHIDPKHIDPLASKHIDPKHIDGKGPEALASRHIKSLADKHI